jgi:hypothetical protein
MKKLSLIYATIIFFAGLIGATYAFEINLHGDLNHRFQATNRADFLTLDSTADRPEINNGGVDSNFGEIKYRLWADATTHDGKVKGVIGTEVGGLRFGEVGKAQFSGDQIQFEVRWAYTDFQLPGIERNARFKIGLQPFTVNKYIWQETVAGVAFDSTAIEKIDYQLAWMRGAEVDKTAADSDENDDRSNVDAFLGRLTYNPGGSLQTGTFLLYQTYDADGANFGNGALDSRDYQIKTFGVDKGIDLYSLGIDGSCKGEILFVNWDLIYQIGKIKDTDFTDFASGLGRSGDFDVNAYFIHFDVGTNWDKVKFLYTFWYASGDDNPEDDQFDAFLSTDLDMDQSIALFEGNYADDNYFTERPYLADKGFIMNRLGVDYMATEKLTVGGAVLYMLTAEDFEYTAAATGTRESNNDLGLEFDVYCKYMLYKNVELAWNAGYLIAGDALDVYEVASIQNGTSDEDIWISSARVRYQF